MKKLMIDLDETICQGGYLEAVNDYLKTDYQYTDIPHRNTSGKSPPPAAQQSVVATLPANLPDPSR